MDTVHLSNFLTLAQVGNMTRCAQRLHLTQPALSAQVKRLEQDLGTPLFHRQGRGLVLTRAGEVFRRHAADALAALDAGRAALGAEGDLSAAAIAIGGGATATTCLLPKLLGRFHRNHPGVRFSIREAPSRVIAEAVLAGEIDLGIVTLPLPATAQGGSLEAERWVTDELVLIVPPRHRLSGKRSFRWKDLHNEPLIAFETGSAVRTLVDHHLREHGVHPALVMEVRAIASIATMVANGIGLGFVSRFAAEARKGLTCADGAITRDLALIERRDRKRSPALQTFRDLLTVTRFR